MMRTSFLLAASVLSVCAFGCTLSAPSTGSGTPTTSTSSSSGGSSSGETPTPDDEPGTPTSGSLPAELVAVWKGNEETLELRADGSVGRSMRGGGTCTFEAIENGTASADNSTLTLTFTSGHFLDCTGPSDTPYQAKTETFAYVLDSGGAVLKLTAATCATGACTNGYDRH